MIVEVACSWETVVGERERGKMDNKYLEIERVFWPHQVAVKARLKKTYLQ